MPRPRGFNYYLTTTWKAKKLYESMFVEIGKRLDLKQVDIDVLIFLHNNNVYDNAKDIAKYRAISKSLVSKSVLSLVNKGHIIATTDENDKRYVQLKINPVSTPMVEELDSFQAKFLDVVYTGLTKEENRLMMSLVERININIDNVFSENQNGDATDDSPRKRE